MAGINYNYIQESFAATAVGVNILTARWTEQVNPRYALAIVTGTFTGSVQIEVSQPSANNWAAYGSPLTVIGAVTIALPTDMDVRFNTTVTTGGPIACFMSTP